MRNDFTWGKVIQLFKLDMDGTPITITKYHPWKQTNGTVHVGDHDTDVILYHSDEISRSTRSFESILIFWLTHKALGLNQHSLAAGICRALEYQE